MTSPRISRIQELIKLEEQRSRIQEEINSLVERMGSLRDSLFEESSSSKVQVSAPQTAAHAPRRRGRTPRGELKTQILAALKAAGGNTVRPTELAKSLGIKPTNVHVWFHAAVKRYPQIKKVGRGEFRLVGDLPNGDATNAAAPKAAPAVLMKGKGGGTKRGKLKEAILDALSGAGAKGITVKDIAEKVGAPYKNVFIWFATTGKNNAKIKKVAPATFRLAA